MNHIREIYNYRDMIFSLAQRELRGKYEKSVLGFLWSFLSPLFQIIIYNMVFTMVFHNDMPNYYIFLMTGLLPWTFFADSLAQATGAIIYNAEMVKKIYFPREVLVIAEVLAKLINMLLSFIVMAFFLIVSRVGFSVHLVLLPLVILSEFLFALGCAFLAASTVSVAGMIGFVGLVVPHISRLLVGSDYKEMLPTSMLLGAVVLLAADTVGRTIVPGMEVPVGIVMSVTGGPFFLYMLRKRGRVYGD